MSAAEDAVDAIRARGLRAWTSYRPAETRPPALFDEAHYLEQLARYAAPTPQDPWGHYIAVGWRFGLDPHPAFDTAYYLRNNPDVAAAGMEPLAHYISSGAAEGRAPHPLFTAPELKGVPEGVTPLEHYLTAGWREGADPGPDFSTNAYRRAYADLLDESECPLLHYLREGRALGLATRPQSSDRPAVLFVAHMAGARRYGGERSFIDLISAVDPSRFDIVAALPDPHDDYVAAVGPKVRAVARWPRRWWREADGPDPALVEHFHRLIRAHRIRAVYANTIMPLEALIAARDLGVTRLRHVRELVTEDPELCAQIGLPADALVARIAEDADMLVANSETTAALFPTRKTRVLTNALDSAAFDLPQVIPSAPFRVGLISSNLAKKGLDDVLTLARVAQTALPQAHFSLIGPQTPDLDALLDEARAAGLTNLDAPGYSPGAVDAIARLHVVLVFSRFAESFGRTAAEAMAARRPVIAYRRGASPEVIGEEGAGFLIPPDEPGAALPILQHLYSDAALYAETGRLGRARAERLFAFDRFAERLNALLLEAVTGPPDD